MCCRLTELYASKALSRSTLVCGLQNNTRQQLTQIAQIPATFFRPLEYILELVDAGVYYKPISLEELQQGMVSPDWCLPLHLNQSNTAQKASGQIQQSSDSLESLAAAAFSSSLYWCLVHK